MKNSFFKREMIKWREREREGIGEKGARRECALLIKDAQKKKQSSHELTHTHKYKSGATFFFIPWRGKTRFCLQGIKKKNKKFEKQKKTQLQIIGKHSSSCIHIASCLFFYFFFNFHRLRCGFL